MKTFKKFRAALNELFGFGEKIINTIKCRDGATVTVGKKSGSPPYFYRESSGQSATFWDEVSAWNVAWVAIKKHGGEKR